MTENQTKKNKKNPVSYPPLIYNVFKPVNITSYDVIRHFKRNLPDGFGKIGHFGTLDPFACGVQLVAVAGAARLNELVHEYCPKTYLAIGKLGEETPTGDFTSEVSQIDDSAYLTQTIGKFPKEFINEQIREKFLGEYWQAPHKYSASKFEGRALHEWAREGIEIQKEKKLRHIHHLEVVRFQFPYLTIRATVSSGTFIRTLFSDIANQLGTIGSLTSLYRESIGPVHADYSLRKNMWPLDKLEYDFAKGIDVRSVLKFSTVTFRPFEAKLFKNGVSLEFSRADKVSLGEIDAPYYWIEENGKLLALAHKVDEVLKPYINFSER